MNKIKIDIRKSSGNIIILCWITIILCEILKLFGYKQFEIPNFNFEINIWVHRLINLCLYNINGLFIMAILFKRKFNIKELPTILISFSILFVISLFENIIIIVIRLILEPLVWFLIYLYYVKDKWHRLLLEVLNVYFVMFLYQFITSLYKNFNTNFVNFDLITSLALQVDYYSLMLLSVIYTFKRGGYTYGYWKSIILILSKRKCVKESIQQNEKDVQEIGYTVFLIVLSVAQLFLVGSVCYFVNGVVLEYFLIICSFFVMRQVFGKSFHADSVLACTTLSIVVFTIATRLPLDLWVSVLCNIFIGCLVAWIMYMWYHYNQYVSKENIVIRSGMKYEDMLYLCERANLTKLASDRMIKHYVNGMTIKEIAALENSEIETVKVSIHRSRKAILK